MSTSLLRYYEAIEEASADMLKAARTEDWDQVVRLEGTCAILIAQLRQRSRHEELAEEDRAQKIQIMQRILKNDAEIRFLTEPWLNDLDALLVVKEQKVH